MYTDSSAFQRHVTQVFAVALDLIAALIAILNSRMTKRGEATMGLQSFINYTRARCKCCAPSLSLLLGHEISNKLRLASRSRSLSVTHA